METNENKKIMFLGPSGIGKTTLAKFISETYGIPFLSGSYSDLVPLTKAKPHSDMINSNPHEIFQDDHRLLRERNNLYRDKASFVTDRSYIDSLAYLIFKLAHRITECETRSFEDLVKTAFNRDCTHLIFMQCTDSMVDTWSVDSNAGKRVTNSYFQWQISNIMMASARRLGMYQRNIFGHKSYAFKGDNKNIKVLVLDSRDITINKDRILKFLGNGKK